MRSEKINQNAQYTFKYNTESIKNINEIEQIKVVYTFPRVEIIEI